LRRSARVFGLALLTAMLVAVPARSGAQSPGPALVRIVHFGFGTGAVDVYADGEKIISGLAFKTASRYLQLDGGVHSVAVRPAGSAPTDTAVAKGRVTLTGGRPYTVAVLGKDGRYTATLIADDFTTPPAGKARIRLLNANPDSPGVDVAVPGGGPVMVHDVRFGHASPYATVPAGAPFAAEIRPAGSDRVLVTFTGSEPLPSRSVVTVVGARSAKGVEILTLLDAAGAGSPPVGGVDTGAGGAAGPGTGAAVLSVLGLGAVGALTWRRRRAMSAHQYR
jgi:hypothetical protein